MKVNGYLLKNKLSNFGSLFSTSDKYKSKKQASQRATAAEQRATEAEQRTTKAKELEQAAVNWAEAERAKCQHAQFESRQLQAQLTSANKRLEKLLRPTAVYVLGEPKLAVQLPATAKMIKLAIRAFPRDPPVTAQQDVKLLLGENSVGDDDLITSEHGTLTYKITS